MIESIILLLAIFLIALIPSNLRLLKNCLVFFDKQNNAAVSLSAKDTLTTESTHRGWYLLDFQHSNSLRGIAILMILLGHISGTFHTVILSPIAAVGVTLFMILSGYGLTISYQKNGLKHFWRKKYVRVMLPYIFIIMVFLTTHDEWSWSRCFWEFTGLKTTYWYVDYQVKWYIVFFIALTLAARYINIVCLLASIAMFFLLPSLAAEQSFAFLIGVVLAKRPQIITSLSRKNLILITLGLLVVGVSLLAFKQLPTVREYIGTKWYSAVQLGINLNLGLFILLATILIPKVNRSWLLIFAGTVSYEIYLIHFQLYGYVKGNIAYAIALIIFSLIAAKLYAMFISKVTNSIKPVIRLS